MKTHNEKKKRQRQALVKEGWNERFQKNEGKSPY
jgi:hypothetical protein